MSTAVSAEIRNLEYNSHSRRDPFVPLNLEKKQTDYSGLKGVESAADILLEGVVVDKKNGSIAIVNGIVLNEGQAQDGVKVLKIAENGVTFEIKGKSEFKAFNPTDASTEVSGAS